MRIYYGLTRRKQAVEMSVDVCNVLGNGTHGTAPNQVVEICAQECHIGFYRDPHPHKHGAGLTQIDEPTFEDIRDRTRDHNAELIFKKFGIDIKRVAYVELAYSPLLAIIFCRLFLKLFPDEIPATLEERAKWWKSKYNTELGDGTVEQYIRNAKQQNVQQLIEDCKEDEQKVL